MVSPKIKFIAITIDELILVPIIIAVVWFLSPDYLVPVTTLLIIGSVIFVAVKYYLVMPSLEEGSYALYDLEGVTGSVFETVTPLSGKVKVGAEIWDARCDEGNIPVGAEVKILSRDAMRVRVTLLEE